MFNKLFLSVYVLKSLISLGTIATLFIGIGLLFVLVYAFIISSVTAQIESDFRNFFIVMFFLSSVMMIVSSVAAIYGLIRKKNKFLVFYAITIGVYFVSFIILGLFYTNFPHQLKNQCQQDPLSSSFQLAVNQANATLCKQDCPCYFPKYKSYTPAQQNIIAQMGATYIVNDNQTLPVNAQNCQTWSNETYLVTQQLLLIETFFGCSGWCNVDPDYNLYFLFSNLNNGIPEQSCVDAFIEFFDKFGNILELSSFLVSGILLLILVTIFCLCFHPEKSHHYDALKFFKESLITKKVKRSEKSGIQIFQIKEIFDFED